MIFAYAFVLGIVCGLVIAILCALILLYMKSPIERTIRATESKLRAKGTIIEAENEELTAYLESLPPSASVQYAEM